MRGAPGDRTAFPPSGAVAPVNRGYRPWLDGLRAVAVAMVVLQHLLGQIPVDLDFVGVGLFFALSGYLITSLLLDERAMSGSVWLTRFYLRRAARLFPALLVVVSVCNLPFLLQDDYRPVRGSMAALTYTSNYAMVLNGNFVVAYGPTWSLAIEEQFYILWPLFLMTISGRYGLRTALNATLGVCFAAVIWRAFLALLHAQYTLLGVGSLERADAMLYGCAAAIALRLGWHPPPWIIWPGMSVVVILPLVFNHESYAVLVICNAVLAIAATAVVVGLDYTAPAWLRRLLSSRPLVLIGVLSYGIYLWHGPLMRIVANFGYTGRGWRAVAAVVAIAVAGLSHRYVETPIRSWVRRRTDSAAVGSTRKAST